MKDRSLIITMFILIIILAVSFTVAFLMKTSSNTNNLVLGNVTPQLVETFTPANKIKENVYVRNNGNIDIYVRVALVFSFEDNDDNILIDEPVEDDDYTISFSNSTKWVLGADGYYYYKEKISPNSITDILVNSCTSIKNYTDRTFNFDVVVESIQADPARAVTDAWGISVLNNGNLDL